MFHVTHTKGVPVVRFPREGSTPKFNGHLSLLARMPVGPATIGMGTTFIVESVCVPGWRRSRKRQRGCYCWYANQVIKNMPRCDVLLLLNIQGALCGRLIRSGVNANEIVDDMMNHSRRDSRNIDTISSKYEAKTSVCPSWGRAIP